MTPQTPAGWIPTEATVTSCVYQSRALSALSFGFQRGERFRITFRYSVRGQGYSGEFQSAQPVPQNQRIGLAYDPLRPERNTRDCGSGASPATRTPLLAVGVAGSVILSLLWFSLIHGCSSL